ncbi:MerR family transcriptional regulator [Pseudomonas sp. N040]|uniref:MerR family transcriptional regulator n=1 Tax=Pseudomonas sp. N040 TaxID=2785325 RepID=UPI0018A25CEA|nr:MerR family transcriptional regulator [Pseudomonas sp. N040]MBF7730546.1 MerR family transcriptional regulator [Pseudomonas sp. N040]MBW7014190.1 MerR family transcriptional regulator [Pseudomonas sp. N040]
MPDTHTATRTTDYLQALADGWLPIREVARQTGVNAVTLRAWERRYGLIKPQRTPKGHRLYDQQQVARINHILTWLNRGVAVSQVGPLLESREVPVASEDSLWSEERLHLQQASMQLDEPQLDAVFNRMLALYPVRTLLERLLLPLLQTLDQRWQGQFGSHIEQVFFHSWLRSKLGARIYHNNRQQPGRRLLLVNLCERPMQPELWLTAWLASSNGLPIDVLDWPVPLDELGLALDSLAPPALLLYASQTLDTRRLQRHLSRLASSGVAVLLIGSAASIHADELGDIPGLDLAPSPLAALQHLQALAGDGEQA